MDEEPVEEVAAASAASGSIAQGVLAGLGASVAGVPLLAVSFFIALFVRRSLLGKLMGRHIESEELSNNHGTAFFADVVLAGATGLIAAGLAALLVLMLLKDVRKSAFVSVGAAGYAAIAAAMWMWIHGHYPTSGVSWTFFITVGWIGAVLGLATGVAIRSEEEAESASPEAARASASE